MIRIVALIERYYHCKDFVYMRDGQDYQVTNDNNSRSLAKHFLVFLCVSRQKTPKDTPHTFLQNVSPKACSAPLNRLKQIKAPTNAIRLRKHKSTNLHLTKWGKKKKKKKALTRIKQSKLRTRIEKVTKPPTNETKT